MMRYLKVNKTVRRREITCCPFLKNKNVFDKLQMHENNFILAKIMLSQEKLLHICNKMTLEVVFGLNQKLVYNIIVTKCLT